MPGTVPTDFNWLLPRKNNAGTRLNKEFEVKINIAVARDRANTGINSVLSPLPFTIQYYLPFMMAGQKLYPRATVKKIVKAHSKCAVSKNVDVLIFLDYALFLQTLVKEANVNAKQAGERGISAKSVKKVTEMSLSKFKG